MNSVILNSVFKKIYILECPLKKKKKKLDHKLHPQQKRK